jgi:hypothetical protein
VTGEFEELLERHAHERHLRILASLPWPRRRAEPSPNDGFLPTAEAAAAMGVDETALMVMVAGGELESREEVDRMLVRPAVVSRMRIVRS